MSLLCCGTALGQSEDWVIVDSWDGAPTVEVIGSWVNRKVGSGYEGTYDHDGNEGKGEKSVRFTPDIPEESVYKVYLNWVSHNNRASNVPVVITHAEGVERVTVNQQDGGDWAYLGSFEFAAGTSGNVLIETTDTDGYVIADAVAWEAIEGNIEISEVTIVATVGETTEGDLSEPAIITLSRSGSTDLALEVGLEIAGTARVIDDYREIRERNRFAVGESVRRFLVTPPSDGLVEGDEAIRVSVLAGEGYLLGDDRVAEVIVHDSAFDIWRGERFTAEELDDAGISEAGADPDGDGTANLGEFFANTDPQAFDIGFGVELDRQGGSDQFVLRRNPAAETLAVQLKTSTNQENWQPVSKAVEVLVKDDTLSYTIPMSEARKQFWSATVEQAGVEVQADGVAYWSFEVASGDGVESGERLSYSDGFLSDPVISQVGSEAMIGASDSGSYFGPDGRTQLGEGHCYTWSEGSEGNQLSISFPSLLQEQMKVRFDLSSSEVDIFQSLSYDTGNGPLPVPDAELEIVADGEFHEWTIDLSELDGINGRSTVTLIWSFEDLGNSVLQIDNVVLSAKGRAKSQLVRNLEAGRLQTVVALGTSITANGAWVGHLSEALEERYHGLATVLNSGAPGKTSAHGVANINSLVIQKEPDTMFIEYGINDSVERFSMGVEEARSNLEYIIDTTLASFPRCEIILMTMTPGDKYAPGHTSYRKDIQNYYEMYREVGRERGFLVIDHYSSWIALQTNDPARFSSYVGDTIHPGAEGNAAVVSPVVINSLGIIQ